MKRRYKYSFAKKDDTQGGAASVLYAIVSLVIFLIAVVLSFIYEGKAGNWIGALGLMAALFSICGFAMGIRSFREHEKDYRLSVMGAMLNGIFCVGWLALILLGV